MSAMARPRRILLRWRRRSAGWPKKAMRLRRQCWRRRRKTLVEFVLLVRGKLRRKHNLIAEVPVAWIGSVIGKAKLVREPFFAGLRAAAPEMPVLETEVAGIEGAVWRAKRLAAQ